jgi:signal peptidase
VSAGRAAATTLAVVLLAALALPFGWRLATGDTYLTVTGRSMEPTYRVGDVLVVQPATGSELEEVGTVVVARLAGSGTYVHRVVETTADGAWLQGDGNPERDPRPITQEAVVGTPRLVLSGPVAGAFDATQSPVGRIILAAAAAVLLLRRPRRPRRGAHRRADGRTSRREQGDTRVEAR